jgi:hypothetical protein
VRPPLRVSAAGGVRHACATGVAVGNSDGQPLRCSRTNGRASGAVLSELPQPRAPCSLAQPRRQGLLLDGAVSACTVCTPSTPPPVRCVGGERPARSSFKRPCGVARRAQVAMWAWGAHVYTRPRTLVPPPHTPHTARRCPAAPRVRATRRCVGPGSDGGTTHRGECEKDQRPGTSKGRLKGRPTSRIALRFSTVSLSPTSSVTMRSSSVVTVSAEGYCASAPSGCGCVRRRHSVQSVLPGARATAFEQPSCWPRLPPPCAWQWSVPHVAAPLEQPSCWHRLPPPCAWQWSVPPPTAALMQPSC